MGIYTIHDDPEVDEYIDEKLGIIVDTIRRNVPGIRSIVLGGGFGKGEGSVGVKNGEIRLLRDFDIFIVLKSKKRPWREIEKAEQIIAERLGLSSSHDYELLEDFHVDIGSYTAGTIEVYRDSQTVDLKYNRVIFGEEVKPLIKWEPADVPERCSWRILLQQPYRLIQIFSAKYFTEGIAPSMENVFIREVSKTYVYIGVALSVLAGRYEPYDAKRVPLLEEVFPEEFPELNHELPDLINKIKISTDYKLDPSTDMKKPPLDFWFEARDDLSRVMNYCFHRAFNITLDDPVRFSKLLEKALTRDFYLPIIADILSARHISRLPGLAGLVNYIYNYKDNLVYFLVDFRKGNLPFRLLTRIASPSILLFCTLPLILLAVDKEKGLNHQYMDKALKNLYFVKPARETSDAWEMARLKAQELNKRVKLAV